jgi:hypothetical protein
VVNTSQQDIISFFKKYPNETFTRNEAYYGKISKVYGHIDGLFKLGISKTTMYKNFTKAMFFLGKDKDGTLFWWIEDTQS